MDEPKTKPPAPPQPTPPLKEMPPFIAAPKPPLKVPDVVHPHIKRRLTASMVGLIVLGLIAVAVAVRVVIAHTDGSLTKTTTSPVTGSSNSSGSSGYGSAGNSTTSSGIDQQIQGDEKFCVSSPLTNC